MDKKIEKSGMNNNSKWIIAGVGFVAICLWFFTGNSGLSGTQSSGGQQQHISLRSLMLSTVVKDRFDDYLNIQGIVFPKFTIYLDAIAGGRVEERFVQQGEYVEKNQPLVRMSNTNLQLDVISREAQISEQLNFLRNTQMQVETVRLDLRRSLLDTDNEIGHLERKLRQFKRLKHAGAVSQEVLSTIIQDLDYYKKRRALTLDRQTQEEKVRSLQIKQLKDSAQMLQKNLQFARDNLDNLLVKAPLTGYLSDFSVELGESKVEGARLGQIDIPGQFKVIVSLDEYYLNKVTVGMMVNVESNGETQSLTINKVIAG
ncbi:efflux transporter periplasmic adaptor subunit [Shewanella sp.]|uniref:efflux RND transporter periplasmic adaptor subunit n=1 Tax=Shewanella sp. TaxID=50422 RepID=UPI0025D61B72|nr:efflux transporter periplasmic adaptor subunit [Shewanella sp.]